MKKLLLNETCHGMTISDTMKKLLLNEISETCHGMSTNYIMTNYIQAPVHTTFITDRSLCVLEFEKKICRSAFRKELGMHLPGEPANIRINVGRLNAGPTINTSRWTDKPVHSEKKKDGLLTLQKHKNKTKMLVQSKRLNSNQIFLKQRRLDLKPKTSNLNKRFIYSGLPLFSSDWLLELLKDQIKNKRSVRSVINSQIQDVQSLMNRMKSNSPVYGVRIMATGRLGKQKKGMAQQINKSIGQVTLGTFKQKIDYSQGLVSTKLGVIGLKVWISYGYDYDQLTQAIAKGK